MGINATTGQSGAFPGTLAIRRDPAHDWLQRRLAGDSIRAIARDAGVAPRTVLEATSRARRIEGKAQRVKISREKQKSGDSHFSNG